MPIRLATPADAHTIARIHVLSWQGAYRGIVPDAHLDAMQISHREAIWRERLHTAETETWLADRNGEALGWINTGASRDNDATPDCGEVLALYVLPEHWSTGAGRALWLHARSRMVSAGWRQISLWVLCDNLRAIRFYETAGFQPEPGSETELTLGGKTLIERRYRHTLVYTMDDLPPQTEPQP